MKARILLSWILGAALYLPLSHAENPGEGKTAVDALHRPRLASPEKAAELAEKIQSADQAKTATEAMVILGDVVGPVRMGQAGIERKADGVIYANEEINEAVVDLFFKVLEIWGSGHARRMAWFDNEEPSEPMGEFANYAASTLSPRLYDSQMYLTEASCSRSFRNEYLARVLPEKTIKVITASKLAAGRFVTSLRNDSDKRRLILEVHEAMEILSIMRESAPENLRNNHLKVRQFVRDVLVRSPDDRYLPADFLSRSWALDVLGFYADPADIPLVRKLVDESIVVRLNESDRNYTPEGLKAKAEKILKEKFKVDK